MLQMVKWGMTTPLIMTRAQAKAAGLKRYYTGQPCVNGHVCERNVTDKHCMDCNRERLKATWPDRRDVCNARRKALWDEGAAEYRAAKAPEWAAREAARAAGQTRYLSAEPCKRGHVGLRTVEKCRCVECLRQKSARNNKPGGWRKYSKQVLTYGPPMPSLSRMLRDEAIAAGHSRYFDGVPCPHGHIAERRVSNSTCCECHRLSSLERLNKPGVREKIMQATEERSVRMAQATPGWVDWDAVTQMYADAARLSWQTGVKHHVDHIVPIKGRNVCGLHVQNNMRVIPALLNRQKSNKLLED